jgi:ABC-type sugar transport system ATPase subunit
LVLEPLLEGKLHIENGTVRLGNLAMQMSETRTGFPGPLQSGSYTLGIRPECFETSPDPFPGAVLLKVGVIEYTGSDVFAFGETDIGALTVKLPEQGEVAGRIGSGATLYVRPAPGKWHLFDASGERVAHG